MCYWNLVSLWAYSCCNLPKERSIRISGFFGGVLLGPIGILLALLTSTDEKAIEKKQLPGGKMKKCPHCAELIKNDAKV